MKNKIKNNRGITLLELIITIAILTLILTVLWSLVNFGSRTFFGGTSKADLQFNPRMAAENLTNDLRFMDKDEFDGIDWTSYSIKSNYPTLDQEYDYSISNQNLSGNRFSFEILVENTRNDSFSLESSVLLLNLYSGQYIGGGSGSGGAETDPPDLATVGSPTGDKVSFSINFNNDIEAVTSKPSDSNSDISGKTVTINKSSPGNWSDGEYSITVRDTESNVLTVTLEKSNKDWEIK